MAESEEDLGLLFERMNNMGIDLQALQDTGMTAAEAALVMGGNMMRVASRVWG